MQRLKRLLNAGWVEERTMNGGRTSILVRPGAKRIVLDEATRPPTSRLDGRAD